MPGAFGCLVCLTLVARTDAAERDVPVYWASRDADVILGHLQQIRDEYRDAVRMLANIEVFARCEPGNRGLHLVIKDGRRRFDVEVLDANGARGAINYLFDGENYYVLNPSQLGIFAADELEKKWRGTTSSYCSYLMPRFGGSLMPVDEFCDSVIAVLGGKHGSSGAVQFRHDGPDFALRLEDAAVVLESRTSPDWRTKGGSSFAVRLDRSRHFVMTSLREEECRAADDPVTWQYLSEVHSEYQEVAPGIYYLASGSRVIKDLGEAARRDNRERTENHRITVDRVSFGDLSVLETAFSLNSLPINPGLSVHDARVNPEVDFVYKSGPFDEAILERALQDSPRPPERRSSWWLVVVNVAAVILVSVWLVVRRRAERFSSGQMSPK